MSDDAVLAAITGLNERLDRLETKLDSKPADQALSDGEMQTLHWLMNGLGNFKERAPTFVDAVSSVANSTLHGAAENGVDPVGTGVRGLALLQRAAAPDALGLAERLLDDDTVAVANSALSPEMVAVLQKAMANPGLVEFGLEFGLAMHSELAGSNIPAIASKLGKLTAVLDSPEFDALLAAGALEGPLDVATDATTALVETQKSGKIAKVGPFGAFFKLMDSDVQKAIGFTLAIAKRFGARLN
jgi:hypothetical protein